MSGIGNKLVKFVKTRFFIECNNTIKPSSHDDGCNVVKKSKR